MSGAEILMDRPPGGWSDLVTNHTLDLHFAAWDERFDRKLDVVESRVEARVAGLEAHMDLQFTEVRAGFEKAEHKFDLLRVEMQAQAADLRATMDRRFRSQTLAMFSTFVALSGVIVAALRF